MNVGLSFSIFGKRTCAMGGSPAHPAERHFAQCRQFGIDAIELVIMDEYIAPGDWRHLENARRWAEAYGVRVHSIHGPSGWPTNGHWLADPDEAVRRRAVRERQMAIEGAQMVGARYCVVEHEAYPQWPYWPHGQPAQTVFLQAPDRWRRSLDQLLTTADRTGVRLAIENVDGLPDAELEAVVAQLDPRLAGVCFDSSHASYAGALAEVLGRLAPHIIGTHLSDNDALGGAEYVDRHWRPFTGAIDWDYVVGEIVRRSSCDCLMLEVLNRDDPQITPELVAARQRLADIARTAVAGRGPNA